MITDMIKMVEEYKKKYISKTAYLDIELLDDLISFLTAHTEPEGKLKKRVGTTWKEYAEKELSPLPSLEDAILRHKAFIFIDGWETKTWIANYLRDYVLENGIDFLTSHTEPEDVKLTFTDWQKLNIDHPDSKGISHTEPEDECPDCGSKMIWFDDVGWVCKNTHTEPEVEGYSYSTTDARNGAWFDHTLSKNEVDTLYSIYNENYKQRENQIAKRKIDEAYNALIKEGVREPIAISDIEDWLEQEDK